MGPQLKVSVEQGGRVGVRRQEVRLLEAIAARGTLADVAAALGLSYRSLWGKIREMEAALGTKLVQTPSAAPVAARPNLPRSPSAWWPSTVASALPWAISPSSSSSPAPGSATLRCQPIIQTNRLSTGKNGQGSPSTPCAPAHHPGEQAPCRSNDPRAACAAGQSSATSTMRAIPLVAHVLQLSRAEVVGVVHFYHDFKTAPAGPPRAQGLPRRVLPVDGLRPPGRQPRAPRRRRWAARPRTASLRSRRSTASAIAPFRRQ